MTAPVKHQRPYLYTVNRQTQVERSAPGVRLNSAESFNQPPAALILTGFGGMSQVILYGEGSWGFSNKKFQLIGF